MACPDCKNLFKIFKEGTWGWNATPHTVCLNCYSSNVRRRCHHRYGPVRHGIVSRCAPVTLDHHIFTKDEWTRAHLRDHPRVPITISIDKSAKTRNSTPSCTLNTQSEVSAIADTDAQSNLWSMTDFLACRFSRDNLLPVSLGLSPANRSPISIEGTFFAKLTTKLHNGEMTSSLSMVHISSSV